MEYNFDIELFLSFIRLCPIFSVLKAVMLTIFIASYGTSIFICCNLIGVPTAEVLNRINSYLHIMRQM